MNTQYRFTLSVDCPDGRRHVQAINVDAHKSPFERVDRCDSPFVAMMVGGKLPCEIVRVDRERQELATEISAALTRGIMNVIKGQDLHNGYQQDNQP